MLQTEDWNVVWFVQFIPALLSKLPTLYIRTHAHTHHTNSSEERMEHVSVHIELLGFWTFSIVWYSREHDVSETGSVSVLR
jgi:hypothetical protein